MLQTMEETGFDISSRSNKDDFIEVHVGVGVDNLRQQRSRLFIIQGVRKPPPATPPWGIVVVSLAFN